MLHYKRPYSSPEEQAVLAEVFDNARRITGLAGGVRTQHAPHRRVAHQTIALLMARYAALGNTYTKLRATDLRHYITDALSASALQPPPRGDYERLIDNALHNLPPGCEVRFTIHGKQPVHANPAPKAYVFKTVFKTETPRKAGRYAAQVPSGTNGSASHRQPHSR